MARKEFIRWKASSTEDDEWYAIPAKLRWSAYAFYQALVGKSRRERTDGRIPLHVVQRIGRDMEVPTDRLLQELAKPEVGFIELGEGYVQVPGYSKWQDTAAEIAQHSEAGRAAGQASAQAKRARAGANGSLPPTGSGPDETFNDSLNVSSNPPLGIPSVQVNESLNAGSNDSSTNRSTELERVRGVNLENNSALSAPPYPVGPSPLIEKADTGPPVELVRASPRRERPSPELLAHRRNCAELLLGAEQIVGRILTGDERAEIPELLDRFRLTPSELLAAMGAAEEHFRDKGEGIRDIVAAAWRWFIRADQDKSEAREHLLRSPEPSEPWPDLRPPPASGHATSTADLARQFAERYGYTWPPPQVAD